MCKKCQAKLVVGFFKVKLLSLSPAPPFHFKVNELNSDSSSYNFQIITSFVNRFVLAIRSSIQSSIIHFFQFFLWYGRRELYNRNFTDFSVYDGRLDIILGEQQQNLSLCNDIWYTDPVFLKTDFCYHLCYASFGHRIGEKKRHTWKVITITCSSISIHSLYLHTGDSDKHLV